MKRALIIAGAVLVLGAVVFASLRAGGSDKGVKVYAADAERREIVEVVKASGEIDPREKVNLSAHVIGKIEKLYVREGDRIEAGRPFLELEKEAFIAQRDQWAAQLRSSQTAVRKTEVMLADARNKAKRARQLSADGIISPEQLEAAALQEDSARLSLDEAREAVLQARANLDNARTDLSKTTIYAPLTGRVIKLNAEEGEVVVSGTMNNPASVIGTIADLSEILARVDIDETEIVDIRVGQNATLKVDAVPNREYHGRVVEVGSSGSARPAQPDVTFFEVKILLEDADEALRPGMSVRSEIRAAAHRDAVVVPIQAVVERPPLGKDGKPVPESDEEVKVVFAVESEKGAKDGKGARVRQRQVTTGISDETHVEVLSGLAPGAKVVTGPYRTLRDLKDGDAVTVSATTEAEDRRRDEEKAREKD